MLKQFSHQMFFATAISFFLIYLASLVGWVSIENEPIFRHLLLVIFFLSIGFISYKEIISVYQKPADIISKNIMISFSLAILLIFSILHKKMGNYTSGVFVGVSVVHFFFNRKLYALNRVYYFLFFYAVFLFFGTIGSSKGFHFPELTISFYLIPLSYIFFSLSKENYIQISRVVFRSFMLFITLSLIYWWYNFLHLDISLYAWISKKLFIEANMIGWEAQTELLKGGFAYQAFFFVNSWAYIYHPSYISLTLLFGLIIGLYLFYKNNNLEIGIDLKEIILFNLFLVAFILLMESRIGVVGYLFTISLSSLYFLKLKKIYFKFFIITYILVGLVVFYLLDDGTRDFLSDKIRATDFRLALSYIKEHLFWGSGFGDQALALSYQEQISIDTIEVAGNIKSYTHNQFMGNMVQFGIWGLIALIILLAGLGRYAIKQKSYLLQMFLCVVILFMLIEEPLYTQIGVTRFTVFLSFFVAISQGKNDNYLIWQSKSKRAL